MRSPPPSSPAAPAPAPRDADALFRTKKIPEIRALESSTLREIDLKKEELRQLVGHSYRDLIDSADALVLMRSSAESISSTLDLIDSSLLSLSSPSPSPSQPFLPSLSRLYAAASRVKYLVDTPENIWGCLDESMLWEASGRYLRANVVHALVTSSHADVLAKFPLLRHQWQIVESFRAQISMRSREKLADQGLAVAAYADALGAAATIDDLHPRQMLALFLDSRRSWISLRVANFSAWDMDSVSELLCYAARVIRSSLGQVGELFLQALNELPLFYKVVLGSPPGTQLFGGVPNPEEEVKKWRMHMERLESMMVAIEPEYLAQCASKWLRGCCNDIFKTKPGGMRLITGIDSGEALGRTEKLVREVLDCREGTEGSLEQWLKSVFGSEFESAWDQIRELILKDGKDILEDTLEEILVERMKEIVESGFEDLKRDVNIEVVLRSIVVDPVEGSDFELYLNAPSSGGVWFLEPNHRKNVVGYGLKPTVDENDFQNCLNAYLGPDVSRIRDEVDSKCGAILEDLLSFVESHNSVERLKLLAPFLQDKCEKAISFMLQGLDNLLTELSASLESGKGVAKSQQSPLLVKRALFIGRLLFAFRNHSSHIPLILCSPRQWVKDTNSALFGSLQTPVLRSPGPRSPRRQACDSPRSPRRQPFDSPRRQMISAAVALFPMDDNAKPKYEELNKRLRDLCVKAHSLWISWVSNELSIALSKALDKDDSLSSTTSLKGWEVTMIKQGESSDGPLDMKIELPSMPSLYISSFLFRACHEIHRIGGHVLDKQILQKFAWRLSEKVISIYQSFLSAMVDRTTQVSEKGILQILLDLRFAADVLSGGNDTSSTCLDSDAKGVTKTTLLKSSYRRKQSQLHQDSTITERVMGVVQILSQKLDPINWAIYEGYLWENEKQSYKRYAVLYGFLVQLNRMHTETGQKLPTKTNAESNILRCSSVPRFKYLPISAPVLSSRGTHKSSRSMGSDDKSLRSPMRGLSNGDQSPKPDFDENSSFGVTAPLFKSFMTQVGSKFGESTSRLGSMLTDAQVGMLRDRSAAAMSSFGEMLPGPAAGLFSSLTAGGARSDALSFGTVKKYSFDS